MRIQVSLQSASTYMHRHVIRIFKDITRDVRTLCVRITYLYEELAVSRCVALHVVRTYNRVSYNRMTIDDMSRGDCALRSCSTPAAQRFFVGCLYLFIACIHNIQNTHAEEGE